MAFSARMPFFTPIFIWYVKSLQQKEKNIVVVFVTSTFLVFLTLSCSLATEYDLTDFIVLQIFYKVTYDGFLHNHFCLS